MSQGLSLIRWREVNQLAPEVVARSRRQGVSQLSRQDSQVLIPPVSAGAQRCRM